ncbi:SMP-30/gluconolactonase/LRE family protein [Micromonospora globispora]|uniref:SMP-30/gluconolactonase/LRE family protein n=1 Tax=Micromonospora globispora TaxID=1450148 RepID=UPI000F5ED20F|nr:SMP-30/gluconolactonase/LRE family protein [Micromonospora globispora]RQW98551.1 strictosidine synthase [Micromonospora globispora]
MVVPRQRPPRLIRPSGSISGAEDGRLWCWPVDAPPGTRPRLLAETGGRPLGIELDPVDGASLLVCDAYRGLLRVTPDGVVHELTGADAPVHLADNAAVARDGTVYFTDSSDRFPLSHWKRDLLEHRPNGRVLAYDRRTGRTEVVASGLYFPNGVALTPDESALMLVETATHRLLRIDLPEGRATVLADLPAYPDNVAAVGDGTYWIALPSPRLPIMERLLPHPRVRQLVALLPGAVQPQPRRYGLVALVDGEGRVLRTLHGPDGGYWMITGVRQHGDQLWLGSLTATGVARVSLT